MSRTRLLVALSVTLLVVPLLFLWDFGDSSSETAEVELGAPAAGSVDGAADAAPAPKGASIAPSEIDGAATGSDQPPTETVLGSTVSTQPIRGTSTTLAAGTTSTTEPPPPAPTAEREVEGQVSWYDGEPGTCAHRDLAFRTVVRVVEVTTAAETSCVVTRRGPYEPGRIMDLERRTFEELAPASADVITVRLEW